MFKNIGTNPIETERLILRRFKLSDSESMRNNWISDINVQSMYSEPIYSTNIQVKRLLLRYISSYQKKDYYRWAIILKSTQECIGQIAYYMVNNRNQFAEIEYCIGANFQNKGYATEATKAVIKYGFEKINFNRVQISHREGNDKSKKVIEKCGFEFEGVSRKQFLIDGKFLDKFMYSILKDDFKQGD